MSNFSGVTFAEQKVTPSDDAIIRRAILQDGILTGCDMSYSGSTLTMAAGQLLVAGRQIRHAAVTNWSVVDASSGFARIVMIIDLTLAANKENFEQVYTEIQYASALNGFASLVQSDINGSGSVYQVVLCVVSLGTSGILGIESQLKPCIPAFDVLWTNASPDSTFPAQTITVPGICDAKKYPFILITSRRASVFKDNYQGETNLSYQYVKLDTQRVTTYVRTIFLTEDTVQFNDNRIVSISDEAIGFFTSNSENRPTAIIGLKGAL